MSAAGAADVNDTSMDFSLSSKKKKKKKVIDVDDDKLGLKTSDLLLINTFVYLLTLNL